MTDERFRNREITWRTVNEYVDIQTGEKITEQEAKLNYIILKQTRHAQKYRTTGVVTITNECTKNRQLKLWD